MSGFFATASRGLEYLLVDELATFGITATAAVAGAQVQGTQADALRALMQSRLASRILWPLASFECPDEATLYAQALAFDWPAQFAIDATFAVSAHVSGTGITHARFVALRLKDAIVDRFRRDAGARPDVDADNPDVLFNLVVRKGRAMLSVDLGTGAMHRRGWRREQGVAPLKETVAAAVLLRGGWPAVQAHGGGLLDPMCGSGTLLIEGALMAAGVAPGLQRHGNALPTAWRGLEREAWEMLGVEARARADAGLAALKPVFLGRDIDRRAINAARANAQAAGVAGVVMFESGGIDSLQAPAQAAGLIVCNPPYDVRLAGDAALYEALGAALRRAAPQWRASLLCGDAERARATALRARKVYPVSNGALECALLVCDEIAPPRVERAPQPLGEGAAMVANRLRRNLRVSKAWREREGIAAWRAYDADIPEYAAAIDVYVDADSSERWLHVQEYAPPADIPDHIARARLRDLAAAAREVFDVPHGRVALKQRRIGKGGSKYGRLQARGERMVVREGAARLIVNLFDYLDTGVFLDHRPMRKRLHDQAHGRTMLNLFCYTGAATVQAALGGAASTTSVDLSATYLGWLADNLAENGMKGAAHQLVQADAMAWIGRETQRYDLIFCDPPTFSNSARAGDFDVQREHVELLRLGMARLAPGGVLYFSNNSRRFRLDAQALEAFAQIEDISAETIPPDFARNARIHRAWRLTARD